MPHAEKTCDPCGAIFTPGEYLTAEQAAEVKSCSYGCSSARANGGKAGPGKRAGAIGSDAVGAIIGSRDNCPCEDCDRIRSSDRSALIARVAAERGCGVAVGPKKPLGPGDLARIARRIHKARLETYDPIDSDDDMASV